MYKYLFLFLAPVLLLVLGCNEGNKKKNSELVERDFNKLRYIYRFYKHELDESHIEPAAYKPRVFDSNGSVSAQISSGDTLIRVVNKFESEKKQADSTIELFRPVKWGKNEHAKIPSMLLGCDLLGVYNSLNEDMPDNFYFCFYANDRNDLLKVVHLYKPGNVSAAFFYTKDSIDPTIRYKSDMARLLAAERPLNLTDTVNIKLQ
jgi:hypothetical protein